MPDIALIAQTVYVLGGVLCLILVARSPIPAALFWGIGAALHAAIALAEFVALIGWSGLAGLESDLRYLGFSLGFVCIALGAIFSLVIPPGSRRVTLYTGIAIAVVIAVAADRLPIGALPLPLILLGILLLAVLVGLRHRPVPARWLLLGVLATAAAELARYRYLGFVPLSPASLSRICFGLALAAFGFTAARAR
ncbi:MAG: hypothetical protein OJJ21_22355 [Ferrovibrio sp.]|uniref:hypothetical protein n=1 Tax=Ferrovibrio sp. TaxID=1917215 RepID=UPI0026286B5B|nr:hypothetical protein [Ferrovibrio sp.]MCW0236357.1 hypothetical protein [Ferrovibrio sp.]